MRGYRWVIIAALLFTAAVAAGCVYTIHAADFDNLTAYVNDFFSVSGGYDKKETVLSAAKANAELWLLLTGGVFARIGAVLPAAALIKRGFLTGFTASAMCRIYGARGMMIMLAELPKNIIMIPLIIIYACCAVGFAFDCNRHEPRQAARFAFTAIAAGAVLMLCAFAEGYITLPLMYTIAAKFI